MQTDVATVYGDGTVERAAVVMRERHVGGHGVLRGVISIDDLIGVITGELARVTRLMRRGRQNEVEKNG